MLLEDDNIQESSELDATLVLPQQTKVISQQLDLNEDSKDSSEDIDSQIKFENPDANPTNPAATLDDLFDQKMSKHASKSKVPEEIKEVSEESIPSSNEKPRYFKKRTREQFDEDQKENGVQSLIESQVSVEKKIKRNVIVSPEKSSSA